MEAQRICDAAYRKLKNKKRKPKKCKAKGAKKQAIDWKSDDLRMWFGIHKGKRLSQLPRDYARWLVEEFAGKARNWRVKALIENLSRRLGMASVVAEAQAESQSEPLNREYLAVTTGRGMP
jgi:hypothetical protein